MIDTRTFELISTIDGLEGPLGANVHPDGAQAYIANVLNGTLSVVDTATNVLITNITVGTSPIVNILVTLKLELDALSTHVRFQ